MDSLRLLVAALCLLCVKSETLTQPDSVTVHPGHTLSISCTVSYSVSTYTAWIRQPAGKGLEWIGMKDSHGNAYYKDSLKNKFSINVDSSSSTVTLSGQNMQPGDSAVYYCARGGSGYFDYWGKGTQVTITSATSHAPTVYPVMPCSSGSGDMVTLACLATGFTPSSVTFSWTQDGAALTDFLQYPSVLKNDVYTGISQIRVKRQDWENRQSFKCKVEHSAGTREVDFVKPLEIYELPSLKLMTTEDNDKVTLSCLANDFIPDVFEFKWLKDNQVLNSSPQFTTPSKGEKSKNGTRYSAASFLTLPSDNLRDYSKLQCEFNLGKGAKQQKKNVTYEYKPSNICTGTGPSTDSYQMTIIPPSLEDILYNRTGKLSCVVRVKYPDKVRSVYWVDENWETLMNNTDRGAKVIGDLFVLDLDITYAEWNKGIKRTCFLDHADLLTGLQKDYVRTNEKSLHKAPSVFMLPPLKHTEDGKVTLTCFVKNFYPEEIYVTWLVDDKRTTHKFNTTNSAKSNGNYYVYSHMTVPMSEWEVPEKVYSCLVYHESLDETRNIVRSITQPSSEQTTMVNLNMKFPDMCKA